ncbi:MAG: CRISPR-associated protein [Deltaproteobacteria bacterium]|nr:CRISPR-associated protein [Deltaproteobacteria bacterium]
MINAMRTMAWDSLFDKLGDKDNPPQNLEEWYHKLRTDHPERLFPFLVESGENVEKIYILEKDVDQDIVRLSPEDMTEEKARWLPFMRPSGSQGAQIGPVIKRSYSKAGGPGPSTKILKTTIESFEEIAGDNKPWSPYFNEIVGLLNRPQLKLIDNSIVCWKDVGYENLLAAAVDKIGEQKQTVFLAIKDSSGKLPGQRPEYLTYLMTEKLAGTRYVTGNTPAVDNQTCPLCGATGVTVFPNALKGAGINISNADRAGAFPGIDTTQAWKGYALCNACADLLYIYKFHFLKKDSKNQNSFITPIAGENAVVIPFTTVDYHARQSIWKAVKDIVKTVPSDVEEAELTILDILKDKKGILNLTFLWATVGQNIEDVTGMITNVPPGRLTELSKVNEESRDWKHPLFPEIMFFSDKRINFHPDLSLRALKTLFYRPDASMKLHQLKKAIAASVYHKTEIPTVRFWEEIMTIARVYWLNAIQKDKGYNSLLYEGRKKTGETFLTAAGWIRNLCWWLYYFKKLEVMSMEDKYYEPQMERLNLYFGAESGIDSPQKAYAFLLGVLYGKVLQVQGARGVNVGANALTWLKRCTLKGRDLPELYIKTREKLLSYETEKSEDVRELIAEIGNLGWRLGDNIELGEIPTNYYLLLGQSMTTTILPKKEEK